MAVEPGLCVWLTGLSCAGKTTLAHRVAERLRGLGRPIEVLDGDVVRRSLCSDLGYSKQDRDTNIQRIAFVAGLLVRNGVIVIVSAISPYRDARQQARAAIPQFLEVYVNAPTAVCEQRDLKGLYARARRGEIHGLTGVDDPYEPPSNPDVECRTDRESIEESAEKIVQAVLMRVS